MRGYIRCPVLLVATLLTCALAGCGYRADTESGTSPYMGAVSMEGTPIIDYTVPRMSPNILVNLNGYPADGIKEAAVKGSQLPENFLLLDAETGEPVYSGVISQVTYNEDSGLYLGSADFSEFDREGSYYLECDIIGQSYPFSIRETLFTELFAEAYGNILENCKAGTLSVADAVIMLTAYEWYGDVFPDEDEDQVPDVLTELKGWVNHVESVGVDEEEAALYAAFLAKFGYNYQNFERQYATDCLKRASTVFGQVQNTISKDADSFFALTEIYRATGLSTYRNQIVDYKSFFENNSSYLEESGYLYGAMTYMVTRQRVDVDMCEAFMGGVMNRAEEISLRYSDMIHPVAARNNGTVDLLKRAEEVSCANYVMNIYQYTNIIEEFLHYLMGRNQESVNFYEQSVDRTGYLLLLAQLAANER